MRKSTKKRKRSEAKEILDAWQSTADRAAAGNLDQARSREIVLETVERVTGKRADSPTVSEWLKRWTRTEKGAVTAGTMIRYEQIVRDFLSSIGTDKARPSEKGVERETAAVAARKAAAPRQSVDDLRRHLSEYLPADQTFDLHLAQLLGEHLLGDRRDATAQFAEAQLAFL